MRTKYKQWAVDYLDEHPEVVLNKFDVKNPFFSDKKIVIEIGAGKGDFIAAFSKANLDLNFLAIERVKTVAGIMAKKLVDQEVKNVLVFPYNAEVIFDEIKDGFVDSIYLNFSDPWPKKRHEKRRLTFIKFLEEYYRILKKGGKLYFKSDNDGLYEFTQEEIQKTKFKVLSNEEDYKFDASTDAMTEYENKFRTLGQKIHRIVLEK